MSSLTKTPAQESTSASTTTSVPAQASTSTTASRLSVGEYHAMQYLKGEEDKTAAPETILEDSGREVPSSAADSKSAAVAHDPLTGSRRPREDDPSASSLKRSRNEEEEKAPTAVTPSSPCSVPTERAPWMPSASEIASRFGATSPPNQIPLYINDDAEAAAQHFDPMTKQSRDDYIGLFHGMRQRRLRAKQSARVDGMQAQGLHERCEHR
ncbi:hypothetical protein PC110_g18059 [Phytophthora cactorum]|uniref:Uncharacterized protein n=1 Tax=Phytophthora cactorum TaxID=29920 RepID=A0A329RL93_9STRA|nr:hypothetical protein PC117_g27029 [Phytophthora cactorum]RAW25525.1 hypothetical protein PC110_g18059 [Phytophthora cactorum]